MKTFDVRKLDLKGWITTGSVAFVALVIAWEAGPARWLWNDDIRSRVPLIRADHQMTYHFGKEQYAKGYGPWPDPVPSDREIEAKIRAEGNRWSLFR